MAGGKMSARQKMINLMYLVFIAMLALNMSKEVLSAFGFTNEKLEQNNITTKMTLDLEYQNLDLKAAEQELKYKPLKLIADKVKKSSEDLYVYLDTLKQKMLRGSDLDSITQYESMDNGDWLDNYFFAEGTKYKDEGQEFLDNINTYRDSLIITAGDYISSDLLKKRFNTDKVYKGKGKDSMPFLKARYFQFPMVASLTNFTQIQTDIRNSENEIITLLLGGQLEMETSLTNYKGLVKLDKTAFYPGDNVTGTITLGRDDPNLQPTKVVLNGQPYENFSMGRVNLDLRAGSTGDKEITGSIFFMENEEEVEIPFTQKYAVIDRPNSASVAADKMNVIYRGIQNPLTISIPGIATNLVRASSPGLRQIRGSAYSVMPPEGTVETQNIQVNGTLPDGSPVRTTKVFRVKEIPAATGSIRGETGKIELPGSSLSRVQVNAILPDFLFELTLEVTSFKVSVPGQFAVEVQGSRMNADARELLERVGRGGIVTIYDIKAKITDNNYQLKQDVSPIIIEVTN